MSRPFNVLATLSLLALCACATVTAVADRRAPRAAAEVKPPARPGPPPAPGGSPYGLFLAGQAAAGHGQSAEAARFFDRATLGDVGASAENHRFLNLHAFTSTLLAGDLARAATLAPVGPEEDAGLRHLGALVRGVEALAQGDGKAARAILITGDADPAHESAAALLAPFAAAAAGDEAASISRPQLPADPISQFFANLDQGKLFEHARRYDEAETAFRALIAKGDPGGLASLNLGEMLERRGRRGEAVAIYDTALGRDHANPALNRPRARAKAGEPAPHLASIRQSAAEALIAPASELLTQKQEQVALAYLRMALRLDPTRDEAWMMVGDVLSTTGDAPGAQAAWSEVHADSPQYLAARGKLAWGRQEAGDKAGAIKLARDTLTAAPDNKDAAITLADLLRSDDQFDASAKVLDGVILAQGAAPDWRLLYMRAVDLQESGRWPDAERDLRAAMTLHPDEPELLNFLGYSWIDRGEHLAEALGMVKKAVDLNPRSGAIVDSLGWAYFRLGDYTSAVRHLETAVGLEPADPDVNDHLGDAYWRVGRETEARFQWRRVLTLAPSAKLKAAVEAKLKIGLVVSAPPAVIAGG